MSKQLVKQALGTLLADSGRRASQKKDASGTVAEFSLDEMAVPRARATPTTLAAALKQHTARGGVGKLKRRLNTQRATAAAASIRRAEMDSLQKDAVDEDHTKDNLRVLLRTFKRSNTDAVGKILKRTAKRQSRTKGERDDIRREAHRTAGQASRPPSKAAAVGGSAGNDDDSD